MSEGRDANQLLRGVTIVDVATQVPGSFCAKLLGDLGARVLRPADLDDPVTSAAPAGVVLHPGETSALHEYLNRRKVLFDAHSTAAADAALGAAALVIADVAPAGGSGIVEKARGRVPILDISVWGHVGPWLNRAASELVLQAVCGSVHPRGERDGQPFVAGGELGQWSSGLFALVAALASLLQPGDVTFSVFEAMSFILNGYTPLKKQMGGSGWPLRRGVEHPSIVRASDGYVVVTTNTREQFDSFLLLIDRPDLLADEDLANAQLREERRGEFDAAVAEWMSKHTRAEVLRLAEELRVPAAIVADGEDILHVEHLVQRGVFIPSASGRFLEPRQPVIVHDLTVAAPPTSSPRSDSELPLDGIRVLDFTAWWSGPSATFVLGALGADVIKVESPVRFDGVRTSQTSRLPPEDDWWETSCLYHFTNANKRSLTLDLEAPGSQDVLDRLIRSVDLVIENYSVRVFDRFGITWERIQGLNPEASFIRMPAFGLDGPWRDRTAFSQTIEAISGLAHMTGSEDGPPLLVRGGCDPIAGLTAAAAFLAALHRRQRHGGGAYIEVPMVEAALNVAAPLIVNATAYGVRDHRRGNKNPLGGVQGVYRCVGDDEWVAVTAVTDNECELLAEVVGVPAKGISLEAVDRAVQAWAARRGSDDAAAELVAEGIAAVRVSPAGDILENEQLRSTGVVESYNHPLLGRYETLGLPFRYTKRALKWIRTPPPTLGQHTDEVLLSLGLEPSAVDALTGRRAAAKG